MNILLRFLNLWEQNTLFVYSPPISEPWMAYHLPLRVTIQEMRDKKTAPLPCQYKVQLLRENNGYFTTITHLF